jgi:hypothetical protein
MPDAGRMVCRAVFSGTLSSAITLFITSRSAPGSCFTPVIPCICRLTPFLRLSSRKIPPSPFTARDPSAIEHEFVGVIHVNPCYEHSGECL